MSIATIKLTGAQELRRKIARIQEGVPKLSSRALVGNLLVNRWKERFDKELDPNGVRWTSLAPTTKRNGKILHKSGQLRNSIAVLSGATDGRVASATGAGFRIGVLSNGGGDRTDPSFYGRFHQRGFGVPKRRFLGISISDQKAVSDKLRREIKKLLR